MPKGNTKKLPKTQKESCFLITPIGHDGSPERKRVDQWFELIYKRVLNDKYDLIRADRIATPGIITEQIIQNILNADLVIIDYTDLNPNVMYEAALRHLVAKPYIQIYEYSKRLPFDTRHLRSIGYDSLDIDYPANLIKNIKSSVNEINDPGYEQPEIVKEKFDFNKIISDPEKFVNLLKKFIVPNVSDFSGDKIVKVNDYYVDAYAPQLISLGNKKIVCPKCGTIKYENPYIDSLGPQAGVLGAYSYGSYHYKCKVCGNEFESPQ